MKLNYTILKEKKKLSATAVSDFVQLFALPELENRSAPNNEKLIANSTNNAAFRRNTKALKKHYRKLNRLLSGLLTNTVVDLSKLLKLLKTDTTIIPNLNK
ncbi:hypothetical protein [Leptobacterium sp. I13]|uniref:hypothetical protein n=1 Tax=Leptobacterium meishanense TaxID=3128904 RepID=UPI0030EF0515